MAAFFISGWALKLISIPTEWEQLTKSKVVRSGSVGKLKVDKPIHFSFKMNRPTSAAFVKLYSTELNIKVMFGLLVIQAKFYGTSISASFHWEIYF